MFPDNNEYNQGEKPEKKVVDINMRALEEFDKEFGEVFSQEKLAKNGCVYINVSERIKYFMLEKTKEFVEEDRKKMLSNINKVKAL